MVSIDMQVLTDYAYIELRFRTPDLAQIGLS
jgi:hypothetical protein